ncbi:exonuclease subunit SbcD [Desulfofundulus thermobenzoicus]|uniref:Nuclease SbcCD subunit D n=1 Tax=Desulfofundulus thermobenzoicus TaxID=29376 RepID=A0A6N7ISB3_9FIRM|nr:exonuclease SbcCD subunit D [Desulfofundulus thermobenzoicus]MQL53035.1 exonuclease subunit SbcD [Desulfofundulus thermobenzoicus]
MRFLHTSDWHLGRTLEGRSRQEEQEEFLRELCRLVRDERIDVVLVAGDVFDAFNPPASAEQLFYDALDELAAGGKRAVVVIAGNHDSPERLVAASPLARRHGIILLGLPREGPAPFLMADSLRTATPGRVAVPAGGPSWLELAVPGCGHTAVLLALPYPSEARLRELFQRTIEDEAAVQQAYSARMGRLFDQLAVNFRPETVNLAMSHLFVQGGLQTDSERPIFSLGGANTVLPGDLPLGAQYVALGHLHRPQAVAGAAVPCRYAGSPLAYSFSEAGQAKSVTVVELQPGRPADIKEVHLSCGRPLVEWEAREGLDQVYRWLEEGRDGRAWINLKIWVDAPLPLEEVQRLRRACGRFIDIRPVYPERRDGAARESRAGLPVDELFARFYEHRLGVRPGEQMVALFLEILNDGENPEGGAGAP